MIVITSDVHHRDIRTEEKEEGFDDETKYAIEMVKLAKRYKVNVTIFGTGKSLVESCENWKKIVRFENVEIGGHTFYAFSDMSKLKKWRFKVMYGSFYGPPSYQKKDILATRRVFQEVLNIKIKSWRTHAFSGNKATWKILDRLNFKIVSDTCKVKGVTKPSKIGKNLYQIPISVPEDHSFIHHFRGEKETALGKWKSITLLRIEEIKKKGGIFVLLAHPLCMKAIDNFKTLREIFRYIKKNKYTTYKISEIVNYVSEFTKGRVGCCDNPRRM